MNENIDLLFRPVRATFTTQENPSACNVSRSNGVSKSIRDPYRNGLVLKHIGREHPPSYVGGYALSSATADYGEGAEGSYSISNAVIHNI